MVGGRTIAACMALGLRACVVLALAVAALGWQLRSARRLGA